MSNIVPFATTLDVRDRCLCLHLQRAARAMARHFDEALRPAGMTNGQFSLLMALNRPEPPTIGPVAELLAMDRTTLTAALKPLERDGLVWTEPDPRDARRRRLLLTPAGSAALALAVPLWRAAHDAAEEGMGEDGAALLRARLAAIGREGAPSGADFCIQQVSSMT